MAKLEHMPPISIDPARLAEFGTVWQDLDGNPPKSGEYTATKLGNLIDEAVGKSLGQMLGGIPIVRPKGNALMPAEPDCVEVGPVKIVGSIRPQRFDVAYRPDGVRFTFDSKTLNPTLSIGKNLLNMINDLGTESSNVHSRFPEAVVGFIVAMPRPSLLPAQEGRAIEPLLRLAQRDSAEGPAYKAEAVSFMVWIPENGTIDPDVPEPSSPLRIERFSEQVETAYLSRYSGFPPHA